MPSGIDDSGTVPASAELRNNQEVCQPSWWGGADMRYGEKSGGVPSRAEGSLNAVMGENKFRANRLEGGDGPPGS